MRTATHCTAAVLIAVGVLMAPVTPALAGPIDCSRAKAADEVTVCADCALGRLDERMSTSFKLLAGLVGMGTRGAMYDEQEEWENERAACKDDKACLRKAYERRIARLQKIYDRIKAQGPF